MHRVRESCVLVVVGTLAMALGLLVYLADRDAARAALIPAAALSGGPFFGVIGNWLPSFVHPFAFVLFSAAAGSRSRHPVAGVCAMWWTIGVAFELGQHPGIARRIAEWLSGAFGGGGVAQRLADYFLLGTFDAGDIVATTLGAAAAAVVLSFLDRRESRHAH